MKLCALASLLLIVTDIVSAGDRLTEPPAREAFSSPSLSYEFVITMVGENKDWARFGSMATLVSKSNAHSEVRWEKALPHNYRPRFVVVDDAGHVVLFDQWINVAGPYAVMVLDANGSVMAEYDFHAIAAAVGVHGRDIVRKAKFGSWMSTLPEFDAGMGLVTVGVGGKQLLVNMSDGQLVLGP